MSLTTGSRLGPYEILSPIGAGGMGEVWKARDTRLDRIVAIKTSAAAFTDRFMREARAVAALNHPNVCTLYDVGPDYLVMEYIEGDSPAGPLPVDTVLVYAAQIAAALDAAHQKGIVHRDLKPANIRVTPQGAVKVLDFGLAKLASTSADGASSASDSNSPTALLSATQAGAILGTAAYMSPEQARGKQVDKRADIWAFGVVLYELSTGDNLFAGPTVADTLAQILTKEPDLTRLPPQLDPLVRSCLEKDVARRLRDIGDARLLLARPPEMAAALPPAQSHRWKWAAAATAAAVLVAAGIFAARPRTAPAPPAFRFSLRNPEGASITQTSALALSPDGRHLAFSGNSSSGPVMYVADFDTGEVRPLPQARTGPRTPPFYWSPDSRYIGFSSDIPKIRKVDIVTGAAQDICDKPGPPVGGSWNRQGVIIFGSNTTGLWRVSANGGKAVPLTHLDPARQEREHELPSFLPDGRHYLYLAISTDPAKSAIYAASLDDPPGKPPVRILSTENGVRFVPGAGNGPGWLLFMRDGSLMAQFFDPLKLALMGNPRPIPARVGIAYQTPLFAATPDLLAYRSGGSRNAQLTWVDGKTGKTAGTAGEPGMISSARLSPDETRVVYAKENEDNHTDLWILDLARGGNTRLTFGGADSDYPVWSPDGSEVVFARFSAGAWEILRKRADGSSAETLVLRESQSLRPQNWSKDGRFLLFTRSNSAGSSVESIAVLPMDKGSQPFPFSANHKTATETGAQFSPDGRFVAYVSDETGRTEVYVRPFSPSPGAQPEGKWMVSTQGARLAEWSPDGARLLWVSLNPVNVMSAAVNTAHGFQAGVPELLYPAERAVGGCRLLTRRGQGLQLVATGQQGDEPISLVMNWASLLPRN